jgi:Activator of Hsp90 ATPase homolog 1-like protein
VSEPLLFRFEVDCEREHAFAVWTERIGAWWPPTHTVNGDAADVVLEARLGGRLYERTAASDEVPWGEVTVWEPPEKFGYLWHIRRDRSDATDVVITFVDLGGDRTRVEIEHTGWERLGADAESWRARNERAWTTLFPHFEEALTHERSRHP